MGKDQEFLEAARKGDIGYIEKVLGQKAKRHGPFSSIRRGTGVNVQDSGGYSALHHACLNGHEDIVRLLLAHDASPNLPDSRGSSPLHLAAWAGETKIVKLLLDHPSLAASANLQTSENETPLHCAAQHGHTDALALLLAHGADPNMSNSRGETPLDLAAQYGRLQAVQMLIRAHPELIATLSTAVIEGGNLTAHKSRHQCSPLPHSGSVSTPSPSSLSVGSSPATPTRNHVLPHTCLHLASRNGHKNVVEVLLAAGVSVNLLTDSGTALHEAALCGKEGVVRTLLKAGIDLNATDHEGRTALDLLKEFPPHVTKHIINVINNFKNQMDTDDGEEVIYRHPVPSYGGGGGGGGMRDAKQNRHYQFNSNNHLLNHSHSMQPAAYSGKQRFSSGGGGNFNGKSLDSALLPDDRFGHDINSPVHSHSNASQNDMGLSISPSSSMSSFEPASVSPRSRCSLGGQPPHMSTFAPGAPPKKPPRRNLSVSPTHTGQTFTYTSPNHQQSGVPGQRIRRPMPPHRSPSNDSPYSHQSHSSVGGNSFDETQMRERQRTDRLYASARDSTRSAAPGMCLSSSNDMLDRQCSSETSVQNSSGESPATHSMKRPIPAPRSNNSRLSKELVKVENPTLKSYNPNRKLKRNRNSCSLNVSSKADSDPRCEAKQQIPSSPTHYKQPPTPDHPPPSSSQAERTIHERIRPLSQEYKRRSALLQLQAAQQLMLESGASPAQLIPSSFSTSGYDSPPTNTVVAKHPTGTGSTGSLSSTASFCSDHSLSTDYVEEFVSDVPFAGLLKGATPHKPNGPMTELLPIPQPRIRPPIPAKPQLLPECRVPVVKPPVKDTSPAKADDMSQLSVTASSIITNNEEEGSGQRSPMVNSINGQSQSMGNASNLLSPFNAEEARKKISEIIENFGSGILNTNITPTHDIELDFEDLEVPPERRELAVRLRAAGLLHLERMLFENGYDNYKFVHNVFDENDVELLHIPEKDATKLLRFVLTLPAAEFQPQVPSKTQQENKLQPEAKVVGVSTLQQWLQSIALPEYIESFNKHLYNTIECVCGVWDVELQSVFDINKLGHRRRILQSLAYIRQMREPKSAKTPLGENNETNKMTTNGNKEPPPSQAAINPQHRNSITGYRKNRPAPQPPVLPGVAKETAAAPLHIRSPSELLLGLPANLRTKWRHSANTLLNEQIKYEVNYLGSTVVKELRGTESTKKSIQKLKSSSTESNQNEQELQQQQPEQQQHNKLAVAGNGRGTVALLSLAISHRGVEFIDVNSKRTICEHEIQNINCACQDSEDLHHFAYITKEQDLHYCHVFNVQSTDLATEIILTLGQAFEVAYQLALRDGIANTPTLLDNGILQGEYCGGK